MAAALRATGQFLPAGLSSAQEASLTSSDANGSMFQTEVEIPTRDQLVAEVLWLARMARTRQQIGAARQLLALAAEMLGYIQPRKDGPPPPELTGDPEGDTLLIFTVAQRLGLFEPEAQARYGPQVKHREPRARPFRRPDR
jgi:hypothetical protein